MKDSTPSLILYITASILMIIGKIFELDSLMLVVKPMVVPAIYYYYLQTRTSKVSVWFSIAIWLFFVADMIMLIWGQSGILWIMACGIASYLVMTVFAISDCDRIKVNAVNIIFVLLLLALLTYLLVTILKLNIDAIMANYIFYATYGIVLIIVVTVSAFNYLNSPTPAFLHLCLMALCMLLSDLFYALNRFVVPNPVLDHINLFAQFLSYYFMVSYFNMRQFKEEH